MNPQTQKPTNNKDFDFILNQNSSEGPVKKGPDKKIIAIVVLIIATLLVMGTSFIIGSNKKVQKSSESNTSQSPDKTQQEKASDVIQQFFEYAEKQEYSEAYSLFVDTLPVTEEEFIRDVGSFLAKFNLAECSAVENNKGLTNNAGMLIMTYSCPSKSSQDRLGFEFIVKDNSDGSSEIVFYNLVKVDE